MSGNILYNIVSPIEHGYGYEYLYVNIAPSDN